MTWWKARSWSTQPSMQYCSRSTGTPSPRLCVRAAVSHSFTGDGFELMPDAVSLYARTRWCVVGRIPSVAGIFRNTVAAILCDIKFSIFSDTSRYCESSG